MVRRPARLTHHRRVVLSAAAADARVRHAALSIERAWGRCERGVEMKEWREEMGRPRSYWERDVGIGANSRSMSGGQAWTPRDPEIRNFLRSQWWEMPKATGGRGSGALAAL